MTSATETRVDRMARAARDPIVVLHKFNKLRSRHPDDLVFVFEGDDDPIFYSVVADRCGLRMRFLSLVAGGKDLVLGFRQLLKESTEARKGLGVAFFIDRDFDDLKGHPPSTDIYCTPTYSIENLACSTSALKQILYNEFKLHDPDLLGDADRLVAKFSEVADDFARQIRDVNLLIYFGRTRSRDLCHTVLREIDDSPAKLFDLDSTDLQVVCHCRGDAAFQIVRFSTQITLADASVIEEEFNMLDPITRWRGKFWFALLQKFISILQEDRNSNAPRFFTKGRGKVRLSMGSDSSFRILASACEIPNCLQQFFNELPANAMQ